MRLTVLHIFPQRGSRENIINYEVVIQNDPVVENYLRTEGGRYLTTFIFVHKSCYAEKKGDQIIGPHIARTICWCRTTSNR